jgi:hypothetical protein
VKWHERRRGRWSHEASQQEPELSFSESDERAFRRARQKRLAEEHRHSWRERLQLSGWPTTELEDDHWEVVEEHGVSKEIATVAGLRSIRSDWVRDILPGHVSRRAPLPALGIPIADLGVPVVWSWLLRPDEPRVDNRGKRRKYENVTGEAWRPFYVLPGDADRVLSSSAELWITEGVFDALALESKGCAALGLTAGTWGWKSDGRPHEDWAKVNLEDRPVKIAFDADQLENPHVRRAALGLEEFLVSRGALPSNIEVVGAEDLSDYIAKGGDPDLLLPYPPSDNEPFDVARDVIKSLHTGTRYQLAMALLDDMWRQGLRKSSRSMTQLAGIAGVSPQSAWRFGRAVASGDLPPFAADGWHSWSNGWKSRILILDKATLGASKGGSSIRNCVGCHQTCRQARARLASTAQTDAESGRRVSTEPCGVMGRIRSRNMATSGGEWEYTERPRSEAPA